MKSSINLEVDDKIKVKNGNKDVINTDNNELNSNLLVAEDDNILFNFKNKFSKIFIY